MSPGTWRIALAAVAAACLTSFIPLNAQAGPEIKRLDAFVGKWRLEVDFKATATTQAFKASGTEDCVHFANMHVVCTADAGTYRAMRTLSYLPGMKQYGQYTVDSYGYAVYSLGQVRGSTWTFTIDVGGVKGRTTVNLSGDAYTSTYEYAGADGKWVTASVTKAVKMK